MSIYIALIALSLERFFTYPMILQMLYRHPVEWMGSFIIWFESRYNRGSELARLRNGFFMLAILLIFSLSAALVIKYLSNMLPFSWVFEGLVAFTLLSSNQLGKAVKKVKNALSDGLSDGREAVSHIVGRDVSELDEAEISRAAIETLAENTSDGYIAPLFYLLIAGLPGIIIYKAINTADSMVGHRNKKYKDFGFMSAKLDDVVNFIPARISAILFILTAAIYKNANWREAIIATFRDAHKHASPNAGWVEASFAGALGFKLGGKRTYQGVELDLPAMGNGKHNLSANDIEIALDFYDIVIRLVYFFIFVGALIFLILQY